MRARFGVAVAVAVAAAAAAAALASTAATVTAAAAAVAVAITTATGLRSSQGAAGFCHGVWRQAKVTIAVAAAQDDFGIVLFATSTAGAE